jgi:hypothetical protein
MSERHVESLFRIDSGRQITALEITVDSITETT